MTGPSGRRKVIEAMDSQLVVLSFATVADAERAVADLQSLDAQGFVSIDDGALLTRGDDGTVTVKPLSLDGVAKGTSIGGVLGLIAGGVIGLPVLGLLTGGAAGASHSIQSERLEELMSTIGREMESGTAVVALEVSAVDDPAVVADRLAVDTMTSIEIPAELRAHIEAQRASRGN